MAGIYCVTCILTVWDIHKRIRLEKKGIMSQSKVDQRKYEKKHRKEIMRKQKIKKVAAITATIVVIAAIVGSVVGVKIYKAIPKYVSASGPNGVIDDTWEKNYGSLYTATASDAEEETDTAVDTDTEEASDTASDSETETEADTQSETSEE